jgi:phenylpyruvate tautomerase
MAESGFDMISFTFKTPFEGVQYMPQITVTLSKQALTTKTPITFLQALSKSVAEILHKPEKYVVASLVLAESFCMAGKEAPCCYIEVSSIGPIMPEKALQMTKEFCDIIVAALQIDPSCISIRFMEHEGRLWGWNHQLFS